jgi:metal-responsive CopG/Arc/MetJ family transcriptional regulator
MKRAAKQVSITLNDEELFQLNELSQRQNVNRTELIREAIRLYQLFSREDIRSEIVDILNGPWR